MPLLLRTAEQGRGTGIESVMSMALSMLALVRDDDISLDCAFIMLLHSYMGSLRLSQPSRRHASP